MCKKYYIISCILFHFLILSNVNSNTIHVPGDSANIQLGINGAIDYDTVLVADGIYTGAGNRDIDFGGNNIILMSENGPGATTIDCEGTEMDSHQAFYFHSGEDSLSMVHGFTITNAYWNSGMYNGGGAIQCSLSAPSIVNCVITGNSTNAVYCIDNELPALGSGTRLDSCTISNNDGRGVYVIAGAAKITGSEINNNDSAGVVMLGSGTLHMSRDIIAHNGGFGVHFNVWAPTDFEIQDCSIIDNVGGIEYYYAPPKAGKINRGTSISNCLVAFNDGTGISSSGILPFSQVECSNSFGNTGDDWATFPDFEHGDGYGNLSLDPQLCDTVLGDFTISESSPCASANNSCGVIIGLYGVGCAAINHNWYVKANGSGDAPTIQAAVDSAVSGDTILVAAGTYTGEGNRDIDFGTKGLVLISQSGPEATIIDCQGTEQDQRRAISSDWYGDSSTVEGFTLTNIWVDYNGAIDCRSQMTVNNCNIINNHSSGITAWGNDISIIDCNISNNYLNGVFTTGNTTIINTLLAGNGSGFVHDSNAEIIVTNCTAVLNNGYGFHLVGWPPKDGQKNTGNANLSNNISAFNGWDGFNEYFYFGEINLSCNNSYGNTQSNWGNTGAYHGDADGNTSLDPAFCDTSSANFYLDAQSPCAAGNNSCGVLMGKYGVDCIAYNRTWYVKVDGTGDAPTIQAAVDSAFFGDTILVAEGTFTGEGNRDIDFGNKGLALMSESGPDATIIDCQGSETEPHLGVILGSIASVPSTIDGFTVKNAWKNSEYWGAIHVSSFQPISIRNCIVSDNSTSGITVHWGGEANIDNCIITGNSGNGIMTIYNTIITNTLLARNGLSGFSHTNHNDITIINCTAVLNGYDGFGLHGEPPKSGDKGRGIGILSNNIAAYNGYTGFHKVFWLGVANLDCNNSFGNGEYDYWGVSVTEVPDENGNISEDPRFCDTLINNFYLEPASPGAPGNNTCGVLMGAFAVSCNGEGICGDANFSGNVNLLDITFLIAFLYKDGPFPPIPNMADVDGSGIINLLDITYLLDYLYKGGPAPDCP